MSVPHASCKYGLTTGLWVFAYVKVPQPLALRLGRGPIERTDSRGHKIARDSAERRELEQDHLGCNQASVSVVDTGTTGLIGAAPTPYRQPSEGLPEIACNTRWTRVLLTVFGCLETAGIVATIIRDPITVELPYQARDTACSQQHYHQLEKRPPRHCPVPDHQ